MSGIVRVGFDLFDVNFLCNANRGVKIVGGDEKVFTGEGALMREVDGKSKLMGHSVGCGSVGAIDCEGLWNSSDEDDIFDKVGM